jgi:plastocyanin
MTTMWHRSIKSLALIFAGVLILGGYARPGLSVDGNSETSKKDAKEVTIVGKKMKFFPGEISADPGEEVTITFKNEGVLPHNIGVLKKGSSVEDFGEEDLTVLSETIQSGESTDVTITIDDPGEYTFVCNIPGHARAGMTGTLVIQ